MSHHQPAERKTRPNSKINKRVNSQHNLVLPCITTPDESVPEKKKSRMFDLGGMYNASLPRYEPLKDKNLKFFFEKPTVRKIINRNLDGLSSH